MAEDKMDQEDVSSVETVEKKEEESIPEAGERASAAEKDKVNPDAGSSGINAEEAEALARGLEWLDSTRKEIPDIPDFEEIEKKGAGKSNAQQSEIDDLIASVIGSAGSASGDEKGSNDNPREARPTSFPSMEQFGPGGGASGSGDSRIDLLMDIPVKVTVVLGNAQKTIGEIVYLEPGAIVELDRIVGEPVDVLANGKLVFKGEVVVIDENFGVRVVEMVKSAKKKS
jgi:flagellar motor switch protein FliN/FliY